MIASGSLSYMLCVYGPECPFGSEAISDVPLLKYLACVEVIELAPESGEGIELGSWFGCIIPVNKGA